MNFDIHLATTTTSLPLFLSPVDVGEEKPRNVCSGIKSIPLEQLENRLVVMLCNLKPVKSVVYCKIVHGCRPHHTLVPLHA